MARCRALLIALAAGAVCACATEPPERDLPAACNEGRDAVLDALRAAPRPVRLDGVALSRCLDSRSDGAELQSVGTSYVGAAAALAEQARGRPEGKAATRLGYLVGAVRRGAGPPEAQGISTELVRRVEQELTLVDAGSRALRQGLEAGARTG